MVCAIDRSQVSHPCGCMNHVSPALSSAVVFRVVPKLARDDERAQADWRSRLLDLAIPRDDQLQ